MSIVGEPTLKDEIIHIDMHVEVNQQRFEVAQNNDELRVGCEMYVCLAAALVGLALSRA